MKNFITILALSFIPFLGISQSSFDLNLVVTKNDRVNGGDFWVKIQVRKTPGSPDFSSGNFSQAITYNPLAISLPTAFGTVNREWSTVWSAYSSGTYFNIGQNASVPPNTGTEVAFGRAHDLLDGTFVPVAISSAWIDVITLKFKIVDNTQKLQLDRLGAGNNASSQQWANTLIGATQWNQTNQAKGNFFDKITYTNGVWTGGNGTNGAPNATDAAKELIMTSAGNTTDTVMLTGAVEVDYFEIPANCRLKMAAGATMRPFNQASATYIHTNVTQFVLTASATAPGVKYSQYIGPPVQGTIQQYVGTTEGWRNMSFPIVESSTTQNQLYFGGALMNFNTASTSHFPVSGNPAPGVCGDFGGWVNNVNVYEFLGADRNGITGPDGDHEWYGASAANVGGNKGYSIFLGSLQFPTNGNISVKGTFQDGSVATYLYSHTVPHSIGIANDFNASQQNYDWEASCNSPEEQTADRQANWDGWVLVANPFPSGLDVDAFSSTNGISSTNVRVWDRAKSFTVGSGASTPVYQYSAMNGKIVPPMQAFFVKLGSAGSTKNLQFLNAHRAFSAESFLKTQPEEVYITAMNTADSTTNHAILAFDPSATKAYDVLYDSYVMSQPGLTTPQIGFHNEYTFTYAGKNNQIVAPLYVNTTNSNVAQESYPLRFWSRSAGNYTFALDQALLNPTWKIYIEDTKLAPGISTEITNQAYAFTYSKSDDVTRFVLHFVNTAFGVNEFANSKEWSATGWFMNNGSLTIRMAGTNMPERATVSVTDITGKQLFKQKNVDTDTDFTIPNNFSAGMYMLRLEGNNGDTKVIKVVKGN